VAPPVGRQTTLCLVEFADGGTGGEVAVYDCELVAIAYYVRLIQLLKPAQC